MLYSMEPRDRRYVKGHGFLSFAENIGKNIGKNISNQYLVNSQKLVNTAKKSATDAIKTASERAIQIAAEAIEYLIGNKIADKVTSKKSKELNSEELSSNEANNEIPKERYISPQERKQIIDESRLI